MSCANCTKNCCGSPSFACVTFASDCPTTTTSDGCNCDRAQNCCGSPSFACVDFASDCPSTSSNALLIGGVVGFFVLLIFIMALVAWLKRIKEEEEAKANRPQVAPVADDSEIGVDPKDGKYDVMISYRVDADKVFALRLYEKLQAHHVKVFLDFKSLPAGKDWESEFMNAIFNSRIVIPIVSCKSLMMMNRNVEENKQDNFLIEIITSIELSSRERAMVFPMFLGSAVDGNPGEVGDFFVEEAQYPTLTLNLALASFEKVISHLTKRSIMTLSQFRDKETSPALVLNKLKSLNGFIFKGDVESRWEILVPQLLKLIKSERKKATNKPALAMTIHVNKVQQVPASQNIPVAQLVNQVANQMFNIR